MIQSRGTPTLQPSQGQQRGPSHCASTAAGAQSTQPPKAPNHSGAGAGGHPLLLGPSQVMELSWAGSTRWLSQLLALIALHHLSMASSPSAHLCSPRAARSGHILSARYLQLVPWKTALTPPRNRTQNGEALPGTGPSLTGHSVGVPGRRSPLPVSGLQPHSGTGPSTAPGAGPPRDKVRGPAASSSILCPGRSVLAQALRPSIEQRWGPQARLLGQLDREVANRQILPRSDPAAG